MDAVLHGLTRRTMEAKGNASVLAGSRLRSSAQHRDRMRSRPNIKYCAASERERQSLSRRSDAMCPACFHIKAGRYRGGQRVCFPISGASRRLPEHQDALGANGEETAAPSPQKPAVPINATSNPTSATKSGRPGPQGLGLRRPLTEVPRTPQRGDRIGGLSGDSRPTQQDALQTPYVGWEASYVATAGKRRLNEVAPRPPTCLFP
jgi:hypothetical protein